MASHPFASKVGIESSTLLRRCVNLFSIGTDLVGTTIDIFAFTHLTDLPGMSCAMSLMSTWTERGTKRNEVRGGLVLLVTTETTVTVERTTLTTYHTNPRAPSTSSEGIWTL